MNLEDETTDGKYEIDGDNIKITSDDQDDDDEMSGTIEDGKITLGEKDQEMVFEK